MMVPMIKAITMPMAKRCNEIANVSYILCGARVSPRNSSAMKPNTWPGVGSTSTENGQMVVTILMATSQNTRQTTGNRMRPVIELRVSLCQALATGDGGGGPMCFEARVSFRTLMT